MRPHAGELKAVGRPMSYPSRLMLVLVLALPLFGGPRERRLATNCGFSLRVPAGWQANTVQWGFGSNADCAVGLRPPGWREMREQTEDDVAEYAVYIGSVPGGPDDACDLTIACKDERGWFTTGRAGARTGLHKTRSNQRVTLTGWNEVGSYRRGGGYQGMREAQVAVVFSDSVIVQAICDAHFDDEETFRRLITSLKIRPRPPN